MQNTEAYWGRHTETTWKTEDKERNEINRHKEQKTKKVWSSKDQFDSPSFPKHINSQQHTPANSRHVK